MLLIPAIDLKEGKCVRLLQGREELHTVYSEDPVGQALIFQEAGAAGVGRMIVINKLDAENIDFPGLLASIKDLFGSACVPLNVPLGLGENFQGVASTLTVPDDTSAAVVDPGGIHEGLIESIIEVDEAVMERYFEGTEPTQEELARLMALAVATGSLIPIFCISSKEHIINR